MMLLSQATNALRARMEGVDIRFTAVSTDTRTIQHGDLFNRAQWAKISTVQSL